MLSLTLFRLPVKRILAVHALRLSPAVFHPHRNLTLPHRNPQHAQFSTSPRRNASEEPTAQSILQTQQKFARIFQEKPELQQLVIDLKSTLEKEGIDVQSGSMPSKMTILKIFMKPDVRDAVMKVSAAFQEAGVNPKDMMNDLMAMQKFLGDPKE